MQVANKKAEKKQDGMPHKKAENKHDVMPHAPTCA